MFLASGQSKRIFHRLHWLLDLRQSAYMFTSARLEAKKYFTIVTTNASFCLFICAFVFASNSGHFRINDFLLFFTSLLLLNYFLFNLFLFLQKSGGAKAPPSPSLCAVHVIHSAAQSIAHLPSEFFSRVRQRCFRVRSTSTQHRAHF